MESKWKLILFNKDEVSLTSKQAAQVKQAIAADRKFISLPDRMVAVGNIASLEDTGEKVYTPALTDGKPISNQPVIKEGNAIAQWVKKQVSEKQWETYYAKSPGYTKLPGEGYWVGFTRVMTHEALPMHLEECSKTEADFIEKQRGYTRV